MKIILLSGGSGKRLWPLSNGIRSKQFLQLLTAPDGSAESMVQRVTRQINESGIDAEIIVATSQSQGELIREQLGENVRIVTEPSRRDTFPAIALATQYISKEMGTDENETVVVMPCDPYTDTTYFTAIGQMAEAVEQRRADLILMGIRPTEPSTKFGYVVPRHDNPFAVERFTEKPSSEVARGLIADGAFWNGGVFAFRLGYLNKIVEQYLTAQNFEEVRNRYEEFPKISFDYEVAEKAKSVGVIPFEGSWKDLGTWDALCRELTNQIQGKVVIDNTTNTTVINELQLPVICKGVDNLIVAISADGILVADKNNVETLKNDVEKVEKNNFKLSDRALIMAYIASKTEGVTIDEIAANSGAERMRIYPILFELEQESEINVICRDSLGAPLSVKPSGR